RPLAELDAPGEERRGVVRVDDQERVDRVRVARSRARERIDARRRGLAGGADDREADDQRAASLDERFAAELLLVQEAGHHLPPFAITAAACLIAVRIRGYVPQ